MLDPTGFWSYSSSDEKNARGRLGRLRVLLAEEMQQRVGRIPVRIFQDVAAIPYGAEWEREIHDALAASSFLIPIITPGFFQSEWCCREITLFRETENGLGRHDLIFPIYYLDADHLDSGNPHDCHDQSVFDFLRTRQWADFRNFRFRGAEDEGVLLFVEKLAKDICTKLRAPAPPPPAGPGSKASGTVAPLPSALWRSLMAPGSKAVGTVAPPVVAAPPVEQRSFWKGGKQPGFVEASGRDGFGRWLEFSVPDSQGTAVTQRMRWIPPGRFLMGSPETEPERDDDEGPQHEVTISQGFWLGDTACTQALWQTVMGANPSIFTGDDRRPVEQVSSHDVQTFLQRIEGLRPGLALSLPTEAEWEYACRAGTTTPFSFGTGISPDQVNYNGNYPYPGGKKGRYRQKTVPVGSLPPNPWGLYEMHGNVWEWCADGRRQYDTAPQTDPRGPEGKTSVRALRGGSWFVIAGGARSACRFAILSGFVFDYMGFRLCLRSSESSPAESAG